TKQVPCFEPELERIEIEETPDHEARAHEDDDGEGHLRHDHHAAEPPQADTDAAAASAILEQVRHIGARDVQGRCEPEEDPGQHADATQEGEHRGIHRELDPVRPADVSDGAIEPLYAHV